MKFLIDECFTDDLVIIANNFGPEAASVYDKGLVGAKDYEIAKFAVDNDWVLVTHNCQDFRGINHEVGILNLHEIHPGVISFLAYDNDRETPIRMDIKLQKLLFFTAIDFIKNHQTFHLENHAIEFDYDGTEVNIRFYLAPHFHLIPRFTTIGDTGNMLFS